MGRWLRDGFEVTHIDLGLSPGSDLFWCLTLKKLLNLSDSQWPHLYSGIAIKIDWDHLYKKFYSSKGFSIVACTAGLNKCKLLLLLRVPTNLL